VRFFVQTSAIKISAITAYINPIDQLLGGTEVSVSKQTITKSRKPQTTEGPSCSNGFKECEWFQGDFGAEHRKSIMG